jgi:putative ABC transport system permease protein
MARPLFFAFYDYDSDDAFQHNSRNYINVRLASNTDKYEVIEQLQQTLEKFSPGYDFEFRPMEKVIEALYVKEKKLTNQVTLLSLLALVISLIGVFGLTMFESEYRHKEIGIRKIFGSSTAQILMMFNKRYLIILAICFILAAPIGYLTAMNWLQSFAIKTVISPLVYICSFLSVSLMTVLTVTWQSWKNANENPVNSIKTE